jgi:predicted PurR-regulated permease PerM
LTLSHWISLIAAAIAAYILWQIRQVILLALTAVVIATVLNRAVRRLQRVQIQVKSKHLRLRRGFAVLLVVFTVIVALALFSVLVVPPFVDQFQQLIDLVPEGLNQLNQLLLNLENSISELWIENIRTSLQQLMQSPRDILTDIVENFFELFSSTLNTALSALLVMVLTLMLLVDPNQYRTAFILLFPSSLRSRTDTILQQCEEALAGWAIGILFNMFVIAVLSGLALWILGIPLAFANALLAGLLTFIPNVGPTLSVIPPMVIGLIDAPWKAIAVLILYIVIQQIEGNILTPLVMQKQVSLLPAVTLLSQVTFAIFFGFLGLLLALPLTVIAQVLVRELLIRDFLDQV